MRTLPLLLALCTLPAMAQLGRKEMRTDSGTVLLHFHATGEVSTREWMDAADRFGLSTAYDRSGKEIFRYDTRRIGGHASVHFSYHPGGAVSRAEVSDAPDAGIQWYRSITTFDQEGNRTGFTEESNELMERTYTQPIGPTEEPVRMPEVAICQQLFLNEVFLVNATRHAGKATVKALRPSPALRDSEHTLAPGDTLRLGTYTIGQAFAPPGDQLSVEVRRLLRNRRKPAATGMVRTDNAPVNDTTQRWYLVVHHWAPGRSAPEPGTR
jgi:hypothetical protein